ncbi:MAG: hypothetical protein QGF00_14175 [Planctomycetota bacterium]|nr:hypothetical protein [Planctomycetota bacterium]
MKRSTDTSRINPRDFDLFVGMDVDKRSSPVAVWDWDSVVRSSLTTAPLY